MGFSISIAWINQGVNNTIFDYSDNNCTSLIWKCLEINKHLIRTENHIMNISIVVVRKKLQ